MEVVEKTSGRIVAKEGFSSFLIGFAGPLLITAIGSVIAYFVFVAPDSPIPKGNLLVGQIVSAVCILLGLYAIFSNRRTTITLDRASNKAVVADAGLLFIKRVNEIPLDGIKSLEIDERVTSDRTGRRYYYDLNLIVGSFDRRKVFSTQDEAVLKFGFGNASLQQLEAVAKEFSAFLNVPLETRKSPNLGEVLGTVLSAVSPRK